LIHGFVKKEAIEQAILDFIGTKGYAEAGFQMIESKDSGTIIAINREKLNDVKAALALSAERILVKKVSGTLNALRKKP
jgi:RNase P/RNase MRP subunit POP5